MRRKMSFSARFGLEINIVQLSGFIKDKVGKSIISKVKS